MSSMIDIFGVKIKHLFIISIPTTCEVRYFYQKWNFPVSTDFYQAKITLLLLCTEFQQLSLDIIGVNTKFIPPS